MIQNKSICKWWLGCDSYIVEKYAITNINVYEILRSITYNLYIPSTINTYVMNYEWYTVKISGLQNSS